MAPIRPVHRQAGHLRIGKAISEGLGSRTGEISLWMFRFASLPSNLDLNLFMDAALGAQFMLYHEFSLGNAFLITSDRDLARRLESSVLGLRLSEVVGRDVRLGRLRYVVGFDAKPVDRLNPRLPLEDIYAVLNGSPSGLFVSFSPARPDYVRSTKNRVEEMASGNETRITKNFGNRTATALSGSVQGELYYGSEERQAYLKMLESLGEAVLSNGSAYKISLIVRGDNERDSEALRNYLRMRLLFLEDSEIAADSLGALYALVSKKDALPLSHSGAAMMLNFPDAVRRIKVINANMDQGASPRGEVSLGLYLEGSVRETGKPVMTGFSTLNLGTLVTGLPGSGKTFAAMGILDQVVGLGRTKTIVIAPTEEWIGFGRRNNMEIVSLYGHGPRINFFRCGDRIEVERFYENLAMLIAHASNSGPYRNSIEKCLLSAFSKVYSRTRNPEPDEVYDEIEEAVIEQHGKRSNVGVKYTKHGENIRAGLENLRLMLLRPQFAYRDGLLFENLLEKGAVFDLSRISNNMKPFFYALVLNQVYAHADGLDVRGNDSLRMLICLEEAQLVFDNNEQSAATMDLRQRIQDFRKKGIGMMLITHNVTDINPRIRRLCQTKMYFRQSADSVKYAAADLIVDEKAVEDLGDRLKTLEHRTCILNYMSSVGGEKNPESSLFVRIPEYPVGENRPSCDYPVLSFPETRIKIVDANDAGVVGIAAEIRYVGERIHRGRTDSCGVITIKDLLEGKKYKLLVFGEKRKDTEVFGVIGGQENVLRFG